MIGKNFNFFPLIPNKSRKIPNEKPLHSSIFTPTIKAMPKIAIINKSSLLFFDTFYIIDRTVTVQSRGF